MLVHRGLVCLVFGRCYVTDGGDSLSRLSISCGYTFGPSYAPLLSNYFLYAIGSNIHVTFSAVQAFVFETVSLNNLIL